MSNDEEIIWEIMKREFTRKLPYYSEYEKIILSSFSKKELLEETSFLKKILRAAKVRYKQDFKRYLKGISDDNELGLILIEFMLKKCGIGKMIQDIEKLISTYELYIWRNFPSKTQTKIHRKILDIKSIPIEKILGQYMDIENSRRRNIRCCFHEDRSPSFKIYYNTNSWYCFSCHKGGNLLNFISGSREYFYERCTQKTSTNLFLILLLGPL